MRLDPLSEPAGRALVRLLVATGDRAGALEAAGAPVDPTAIDWLRLSAAPVDLGDGGRRPDTAWIQRINTIGGLAPAATQCDEGSVGSVTEVPYTADYYFWK